MWRRALIESPSKKGTAHPQPGVSSVSVLPRPSIFSPSHMFRRNLQLYCRSNKMMMASPPPKLPPHYFCVCECFFVLFFLNLFTSIGLICKRAFLKWRPLQKLLGGQLSFSARANQVSLSTGKSLERTSFHYSDQ